MIVDYSNVSSAYLPILSLAVAALAVFFGPILTWKLTGRQIDEARRVADKKNQLDRKLANKQIVAPMRQAWINKLRDNIAELLQAAFLVASGPGPEPDLPNFVRLVQTMAVIELSLNLNEEDHRKLLDLLGRLVAKSTEHPGNPNPDHWVKFWQEQREIRKVAAGVLKREWDRVKSDDAN